jgi:aspartate/methionine/tyrosine aminotransferase
LPVKIEPFALERYFARYEFSARHLLSSSDCEPLSLAELLAMADDETRTLWDDLGLGYTESPGHPLLREAVAGHYRDVDAVEVLEVVPEEGIFLLMHALLCPGDHIICVAPAYQSLYEVARSIGCEISAWSPDETSGWRFDLDALRTQLRDTTRLVVVNFPHNPTGFSPTRDEFAELVEMVEHHGAYLLSDEMYRLLDVVPSSGLPAACELSDRAVSLSGLSKSFGLPGLRVGWVATHDRSIVERMLALKDYTTICASAPSEILALIAMRNLEPIIARQTERVRRNVAVLDEFFDRRQRLFTCNRPTGGSVCLARYLGPEGASSLAEEVVASAGIMLVPSTVFGFGDRHLRIGFGRENLPEVLERFDEHLVQRKPD